MTILEEIGSTPEVAVRGTTWRRAAQQGERGMIRASSLRSSCVVVPPEWGDLNVIIQVEEWHSSDRFGGGTVRARESGHLGPESGVRRR